MLTENHVRVTNLDEIVRGGLKREGVTIANDPDLPRVNLTVMASHDPEMPGAIGLTILIMVSQRVTVHRLGQEFADIPTATVVEHAMARPDNVVDVVERHVHDAVWVLDYMIKKASAVQPLEETPAPTPDANDEEPPAP